MNQQQLDLYKVPSDLIDSDINQAARGKLAADCRTLQSEAEATSK